MRIASALLALFAPRAHGLMPSCRSARHVNSPTAHFVASRPLLQPRVPHVALLSDDAPEGRAPATAPTAMRVNAAVAILCALFTVNQWSRSLIFYLVDFNPATAAAAASDAASDAVRLYMNIDLGFDEAQYAVLASVGFAALFSAASVIAGRAADRFDPRVLLAVSGTVWSAAIAWQGAARSFADLLGSRLLLGFSQACAHGRPRP